MWSVEIISMMLALSASDEAIAEGDSYFPRCHARLSDCTARLALACFCERRKANVW